MAGAYTWVMKRLVIIVSLLCLLLAPAFSAEDDALSGIASWYTSDNSESLTANGEVFDPQALTAAHKTLKFGTIVKVTNTTNSKSVEVKINDRGPFVAGRIIDLTPKAAEAIGMLDTGIATVTMAIVYEPEVPDSKYNRAGDTGWYILQVGAFSSASTALVRYEQMREAGLKPYAELLDGTMVRLSVRWVPQYQLESTLQALASLGFDQTKILKKSEVNPYK